MIAFEGKWSATDRLTVEAAAQVIGIALMRFTKCDPVVSFNLTFGSVIARYNPNLTTWGYATENIIELKPGHVTAPLVIHELGHIFNIRHELTPQQMLWGSGHLKYLRRNAPFVNGMQWLGSHWSAWKEERIGEHWANLFESWCLGLLAPGVIGDALAAWMDGNMPQWIGGFTNG